MADKKITDLQLIDTVEGDESLPLDDSIQTYRCTPTQLKTFVLSNGSIDFDMLVSALQQSLCPVGSIQAYGAAVAPAGWLACDGTEVSRTTYAGLFAVIGTAFGSGDGSTTFATPDLRGKFLRGLDTGGIWDPEAGARTSLKSGGNTGANIGTYQEDQYKSHSHNYEAANGAGAANRPVAQGAAATLTPSTLASGGAETRPKNVFVQYIIKT